MSLKYLTSMGGVLNFEKTIMFEWMKDRNIEYEEVNNINQYSLNFKPIEKDFCNSYIEILGDAEYFDQCSDYKIYTLIFSKKPILTLHYKNNETVSIFEFNLEHNNLIITCYSEGDGPFWYLNKSIEDVKKTFEKPEFTIKQ